MPRVVVINGVYYWSRGTEALYINTVEECIAQKNNAENSMRNGRIEV